MLRYKRPSEPPQFVIDVEPLRLSIAKRIGDLQKKALASRAASRKKPSKNRRAKEKKHAVKFAHAWKKYKDSFAYTQFNKCAFCECDVTKSGYGDVEHYYPKGEVWELSGSGDQRTKKVLSPFGYWWLAYEWNNYLFACAKCNQKFKGSYFPIKEKARRLPPNQRPTKRFPKETPLLLNPYGRIDPGKHLEFDLNGLVIKRGGSSFGNETIRTCGLNRVELARARENKALRAHELVQSLRKRGNQKDLSLLQDCYKLGRESQEHSGMVRAVFKDSGGLQWEELVERCARELCSQLRGAKGPRAAMLEPFLEQMGRERYEHWATVRKIFENSGSSSWNDLVKRRAIQLARDLRLAQDRTEAVFVNLLQKQFYDFASESPSSLNTVRGIFESRVRMSWIDLERSVSDRATL